MTDSAYLAIKQQPGLEAPFRHTPHVSIFAHAS